MAEKDTAAPVYTLRMPSRSRERQPARLGRWLSLILRDVAGVIGVAIILILVVTAVFAPQIAPYEATAGSLSEAKRPPVWQGGTWEHVLGTDQLGQDILSRIIYGSRVSLTVGFFGVLVAALLGVTAGVIAGYYGGWIDVVVQSFVNLMLSVPYLVLVIVVAAIFGRSLFNVILIFGITDTPIFIRLMRGEILRIKQEEYVQSAYCLGATAPRVIWRHMLPNLLGPIITLATFEMSAMIIYESGLSFLGLSVPPQIPSWGNMLALGRQFLPIYPWIAIYPGLAIAITSMGVNLLGDRIRELLDPRVRSSKG